MIWIYSMKSMRQLRSRADNWYNVNIITSSYALSTIVVFVYDLIGWWEGSRSWSEGPSFLNKFYVGNLDLMGGY